MKSACEQISSVCGVSVETSRKALQIVCKDLYNHDVYLSLKEQAENEGVNVKSSKYDNHSYVVPSVRGITEFKQLQASEMEREAPFALFNKSTLVKSTVHFDTLEEVQWMPSLILKFSDRSEYRLRPAFFAFEDRE